MNANDYQQLAARTLIDKPGFDISNTDIMIIWNAVGYGCVSLLSLAAGALLAVLLRLGVCG